VKDKETKMRESLKIMSMGQGPYTLSYILVQGVFSCFTSVILYFSIVFFAAPEGHAELKIDNTPLLGALLLFGMNLLALSMAMSTLFSDSKLAVQVGTMLILLPSTGVGFMFAKLQMDKVNNVLAGLMGADAPSNSGWI
jgi:hypothetical protein